MSDRAEKILALIDQGTGSSTEPGYAGVMPDYCVRCVQRAPVEDSDFCGPCRAFLLCDGLEPESLGWREKYGFVSEWEASLSRSRGALREYEPYFQVDSFDAHQIELLCQLLAPISDAFRDIAEAFIRDVQPIFGFLADMSYDDEPIPEPSPELVQAMRSYGERPGVDPSSLERFNQLGMLTQTVLPYRPWNGVVSARIGR